eukprot:703060-Pelagomonas_calceolata.AAC.1
MRKNLMWIRWDSSSARLQGTRVVMSVFIFNGTSGGAKEKKKRKSYVGRENSPYINLGKGDTLAQRAVRLPFQKMIMRVFQRWKELDMNKTPVPD